MKVGSNPGQDHHPNQKEVIEAQTILTEKAEVKAEVEAKVTSVFEKIQGIPINFFMCKNLRTSNI